jgi:hypothetical protein
VPLARRLLKFVRNGRAFGTTTKLILLYKYADETNHTPSEIPNPNRDNMSIRTKDRLLYEMFDKVHVYFPYTRLKCPVMKTIVCAKMHL